VGWLVEIGFRQFLSEFTKHTFHPVKLTSQFKKSFPTETTGSKVQFFLNLLWQILSQSNFEPLEEGLSKLNRQTVINFTICYGQMTDLGY
jgi:hypothetical protein